MTGQRPLERAHVRVPCSTSNLGAGFDCLGLALGRYLEARYEPGPEPLRLVRAGAVAVLPARPGEDHVVTSFRARARALGMADPSGVIHVHSEIPLARGLGSSAAALVAGHVLADAAAGVALDRSAALRHAMAVEGHPDNAAPCAYGGLVAAAPLDGDTTGIQAIRLPLSDDIGFVFAAPPVGVSTERARAALPRSVPLELAVDSVRRTAALLRGLATASPVLLATGFEDRMHVPVRLPLIPGARAAIDAARAAGAWAVTISGSGSGLIAVSAHASQERVADAMRRAFADVFPDRSGEVEAFPVSPDLEGAQVLDP